MLSLLRGEMLLICVYVLTLQITNALYWLLPDNGSEKCFLEEVPQETLVVVSYKSLDFNILGFLKKKKKNIFIFAALLCFFLFSFFSVFFVAYIDKEKHTQTNGKLGDR